MGFFAGMTLCFSACLTVEGLMPRLLCLLVSLPAALVEGRPSRLLIPLFLSSALLRLVPLGRILYSESGNRGLVLLALCVPAAVILSLLGKERLAGGFLPCGLVLLPLLGFCMAGEWRMPASLMACPPAEMLTALVCPLAGAFLLPRVKNRLWSLAGVLIGGIFGILLTFVSFPVWEGTAAILGSVPCIAAELSMVWGRSAYTSHRRDGNADTKRDSSGDGSGG